MKTSELYQQTTDRIIAELKEGVPPWTRPWRDSRVKGVGMIPSNLASGRLYSGSNILLLWMTATLRGYDCLQFCTYNQANAMGAKVKKGEKSCPVIFTKHTLKKDEATGDEKPATIVKAYSVFHVSQLEGVADEKLQSQQPLDLEPPDRKVSGFVNGTGIDVRFGFNQAAYVPSGDFVKMPAFGAFEDEAGFTGVLCHECIHATSHEKRLDRQLGKRFGDERYAFEELIAELGSAFLCARLGYQPSFRSASYLESWLKVLKGDNRAIFSAASYAGHAADWLWRQAYGEEESAPEQEERQLEAAE